MNATSSLAPSTMDDPFTDTMDMASPYQGQVDDFEIDIDIMEDQPTVADNDFDLRDASPAGDLPHDADMMEDAPEITVTEASHYNDDSNMQYATTFESNQESVESEMVDEEFENNDDTVAPPEPGAIPIPPEESGLVEETTTSMDGPPTHEEIPSTSADEDKAGPVQTIPAQELDGQQTAEQDLNASKAAELHEVETVTEHPSEHPVDNTDVSEQPTHLESNTAAAEDLAEARHAEEAHDAEIATPTGLPHTTDTHKEAEDERGPLAEPHVPYLHPVKVMYQESEISMFPPRDGDTSETYFLANEGLAHESIEKLLKECRTILGGHASPEDSLVFSIDSLGLELSEDDIHVGKVTLSKIVDIYLHLCHNSGVEQPEPLYLTLNTRTNLSAEIAALQSAASEGKGISDVQAWDEEYEQQDNEAVDSSAQDTAQEEHGQIESTQEELSIEGQDSRQIDDHPYEQKQDVEEESGEDDDEVQVHEHAETNQTNIEPTESEQQHEDEDEKVHAASDEDREEISEGQYDFDETNSTGTLTQNPTAQPETRPQEGLSTDITQDEAVNENLPRNEDYDDTSREQVSEADAQHGQETNEENVADEYETEETGIDTGLTNVQEVTTADDDYIEKHVHEDHNESAEEEDFENNDGEDEHEEYEEYADEEQHHDDTFYAENDAGEDLPEESGEPVPEHERTDDAYAHDQLDQVSSETVSVSHEAVDNNDPQLDDLQTVGKTDMPQELQDKVQHTPDFPDLPEDDLISLGDDFFATAEDDGPNTQQDKSNDLDDLHFEQSHDASVDPLASADDDNQNYQLERQGSSAGKRPRDAEEEEFGLDGTPSPGAKRTRSS